ncbi:MAG: DUF362 domain-containing protein [Calditrichia bacterium]|nr:DUF362 domain-containing protein [Calditrichia bacterium]
MKKLSRREFISKGSKAGAVLAGFSFVPNLFANETPTNDQTTDISIINGEDYFWSTVKAVEQLGGIEKYVQSGDKVGLLGNTSYSNKGTYTRPEVLLAVAYLCKEAGASEIISFKGESESYWRRSPYSKTYKNLIADIKEDESDHKEVKIENGKILKEADVLAGFMDYDKVINLPILKNHGEIHLTCTLKNTMGISSFGTNITFHLGENYVTGAVKMLVDMYHNMEHLAQCIADLNLVRKWDLNVVDATEFISDNGPSGPGKLLKENKIIAGADALAIEALCGRYLNLDPKDSMMIQKANLNKLGEMNLDKLNILEKS